MNGMIFQLVYLVASIGMIVWVVRKLDRHSPILLASEFDPAQPVARSLTSMLVNSFYLLAIGVTVMNVRQSTHLPVERAIELTSTKVGFVIVGLAAAHFAILGVLMALRRTERRDSRRPPPLPGR